MVRFYTLLNFLLEVLLYHTLTLCLGGLSLRPQLVMREGIA